MLKKDLKVEGIGKINLDKLSDKELDSFLHTLLIRILEQAQKPTEENNTQKGE